MKGRAAKSAGLFPGQGAFDGRALLAAAERYPAIGAVFTEIDTVTAPEGGRKLSEIVLGSEPATMAGLLADDHWVSQLAVYGMDVAVFRALSELGWRPDTLAGHSLGEIAALTCADVYTVADGARVIWQRVRAVESLDLRGGYMAALSADPARARLLIDLIADESLAVAAENHPAQSVVSGSETAMDLLRQVAGSLNVSFGRLDSAVPFHSPLLRGAVAPFAAAVRRIPARAPSLPVYSAISGRYYGRDEDLGGVLAAHLVEPVRFADAVRALHADGVRTFVECGALGVLGKLVRRNLAETDPVVVPGVGDADQSIDSAAARLRGLGLLGAAPIMPGGLLPDADPERLSAFWAERGGAILDRIRQEFAQYGPAEPAPRADSTADLGDELRELYADALEYPVEVFTDDVLLEAELGIDSVKQVELLARVSERYGLPARPGNFRLDEVATMGKVIDYVRSMLDEHATAGR
ncbi:acyltransferase domain-containing protein [Streptosporangium sp. OZ121]|uniref:acyltransferase domain-containing protein n=1 Tax=Streptosporangium sp. OZ121 TaxID=3444183 RepID=UPI003F78DAF8